MKLQELEDELARLQQQFDETEEEFEASMFDEDMGDSLHDPDLLDRIEREIARTEKKIAACKAKIASLTQEIEAILDKVALLRKSLYDARGQFISDPKTSWEIVKFRDQCFRLNYDLKNLGGECMINKILNA